ncbi:unnamed protein product [Rhodiola kirilowii]
MMTELQTMTSLECAPSFLTFNCSLKDGTAGTCFSSINHVATNQSGILPVFFDSLMEYYIHFSFGALVIGVFLVLIIPAQPKSRRDNGLLGHAKRKKAFSQALRQFGKNFEKITSRVQSKNKDQYINFNQLFWCI